jgi:hypothetical protein
MRRARARARTRVWSGAAWVGCARRRRAHRRRRPGDRTAGTFRGGRRQRRRRRGLRARVSRAEGAVRGGGRTGADVDDHVVEKALALCDAA